MSIQRCAESQPCLRRHCSPTRTLFPSHAYVDAPYGGTQRRQARGSDHRHPRRDDGAFRRRTYTMASAPALFSFSLRLLVVGEGPEGSDRPSSSSLGLRGWRSDFVILVHCTEPSVWEGLWQTGRRRRDQLLVRAQEAALEASRTCAHQGDHTPGQPVGGVPSGVHGRRGECSAPKQRTLMRVIADGNGQLMR
jgi:hypothetical protein